MAVVFGSQIPGWTVLAPGTAPYFTGEIKKVMPKKTAILPVYRVTRGLSEDLPAAPETGPDTLRSYAGVLMYAKVFRNT
ncbi:MAG: hypothetical protein WC598_04665 [Methanoregula sp.]